MNQPRQAQQRTRATQVYTWFVRLYPAAYRRMFGQQMLQTFQDHYRDAVETEGESALQFWLGVAGDAGWSLVREHGAALSDTLRQALRERTVSMKTALAVALTTVGMLLLLGLRVWLYPAVLSAPHGGGAAVSSVAGIAILVLAYALVAVALLRAPLGASGAERSVALRRAALLGALVGGCALGAIAADTVVGPESPLSLAVWSVVVLAATICWGLAGLMTTRAGGTWRLGIVAALWSGMVSALVGAAGEVASTLLALPQLAQRELSNPDYLYWRQPDVPSYAIASALAMGMIGLILAPVAASIVGGIGSWLGKAGSVAPLREETASP
jgi:hypothetical protein